MWTGPILKVNVTQELRPVHVPTTSQDPVTPASLTLRPLRAVLYGSLQLDGSRDVIDIDCDRMQSDTLHEEADLVEEGIRAYTPRSSFAALSQAMLGRYLAEMNRLSDVASRRGSPAARAYTVSLLSACSMAQRRISSAWFEIPQWSVSIAEAQNPFRMEITTRMAGQSLKPETLTFVFDSRPEFRHDAEKFRAEIVSTAEVHLNIPDQARSRVVEQAAKDGFRLEIDIQKLSVPEIE